jgi:GT2 family glycosyltransferase
MSPISVVIPTRDRPQFLREAVESILAGDLLPAELIVADQSERPSPPLPTSELTDVRHVHLSSIGLSRARNAGIAAARHEVLVFTDDDVTVERDWLRVLVDALESAPARTAVTGMVLAGALDGHVPSTTSRTQPETFTGRLFADVLFPNNMALRSRAFEEVGLFDERLGAGTDFPGAEDNDFGYRLLVSGYQISFVPGAVLHHRGTRRGSERVRLQWAYGLGQGAFYAKHMSADRHMARRFGRNARFRLRRMIPVWRGDRAAALEAVYLAGLAIGACRWWRRYGRSSSSLWSPEPELPADRVRVSRCG